MKIINIFILTLLYSFMLFGCKSNEEKEAQKAKDLISARTLGLAYLEEFELENAEKEFLKFIDLAPKEKLGYANLGLTYLRMGEYPEAEKQLLKGIEIDPKDPDIRLILSTVYKMQDNIQGAISQLKEALQSSPGHVKVLYELTEIYAGGSDQQSQASREAYLKQLVENTPGNLVPKLNLTDLYIRKGSLDAALEQLEIIKKQFPDFPKEAVDYYNKAYNLLRKGEKDEAIVQFTIFHNYLKVSSPYQAGIVELKGPGGSLIGFPLITFDQQSSQTNLDAGAILESIQYKDITANTGLDMVKPQTGNLDPAYFYSTHVAACDFDSDGDIDLYVGNYDQASSSYKHYLFSNEMGRFTDMSQTAGLNHTGREYAAAFADYDNDGFFDLYITREEGDILYRNAGKGTFEDVTKKAGISNISDGLKSLFFDADHDGDLDLFELRTGNNLLFRNNADGTFTEQSVKSGVSGSKVASRDAVFGDFNEDGVIDFLVANESGNSNCYINQRGGLYRDIIESSGLITAKDIGKLEAGDYNNDGFLDVFAASATAGTQVLYRNLQNGTFESDRKAGEIFSVLKGVKILDAKFLDFDNDGFLDLLLAGEPAKKESRGLFLLHNSGEGIFTDASDKLPESVTTGKQICVFDYNDDGDLDILIAGIKGGVVLLRNDGGNGNHFIKIKLVGLKAGSAKNNHFGIGAKVEMRSGELYQTMVVTDPNVHFGLGNRKQADIVRITWTNGVPQNIFMPNSDQSLVESQTLKGSCPFIYAWNGEKFEFVKDILWRSALGMPMGIMGGNTTYAFADASDDYLKIPGEALKPRNGKYSLQMTSELWETIYYDEIELVAVDHPESVDIFVPEQFTPPPFPGNKVYQVGEKRLPVSAHDSDGNDVLASISKKDDNYLAGFKSDKYQGIIGMTELVLDPGETARNGNLHLFLTGWIFPTDASINVALSQTDKLKVVSPVIQVINKKGEWETIGDLGFPMGKDKTVIADLTGRFLTSDHRVRIRTNMEIYWDYIFFSDQVTVAPVKSVSMHPTAADLHYRGFSRSYRKGGRYGPHWFDYAVVDKEPRWRDLTGNYTRFGDVLPLLMKSDNQYIISNAGDEISLEFEAKSLPPLPTGWKRDFLIRSVGWVKDGDLNTAFGNTVLPLPFHGMTSYPPSAGDRYPNDPSLQDYNRQYNTRVVNTDGYLNALREKQP